jgi:hypothetical protein
MTAARAFLLALLPAAALAQADPPAPPAPAPADVQRVHVVERRPFTESGRT